MLRRFSSGLTLRSRLPMAVISSLVTLLMVSAAGLAFGIIPTSNEIIGCVSGDGALRIVADASQCDPEDETPISWNRIGPPGSKG